MGILFLCLPNDIWISQTCCSSTWIKTFNFRFIGRVTDRQELHSTLNKSSSGIETHILLLAFKALYFMQYLSLGTLRFFFSIFLLVVCHGVDLFYVLLSRLIFYITHLHKNILFISRVKLGESLLIVKSLVVAIIIASLYNFKIKLSKTTSSTMWQ